VTGTCVYIAEFIYASWLLAGVFATKMSKDAATFTLSRNAEQIFTKT
jgi:hypothetical protein